MTVSSVLARVDYNGSGIAGPFTIPFPFLADADILVKKVLIADGTETLLVLGTDYTLSGAGDDEGILALTVVLPATYRLVIIRDPARTQLVDYTANDKFPAETHEQALDRLTMLAQRLYEIMGRTLRAPESDNVAVDELPPREQRALKYLAFDANGDRALVDSAFGIAEDPTKLAILNNLSDLSDVAAARDNLGLGSGDTASFTSLILTDYLSLPSEISVHEHGAVGDYVPSTGVGTDDTVAIQTALFAAKAQGGGVVLLEPGRKYRHGGEATVITAAITNRNTVTASSGTPFTDMGVYSGMMMIFRGFTNNFNNIAAQVATVGPASLTFNGSPFQTNEGPTANVTVAIALLVPNNVMLHSKTAGAEIGNFGEVPYVDPPFLPSTHRIITRWNVDGTTDVDTGTETIQINGHNMSNGDRIAFIQGTDGSAIPGGLTEGFRYYVISATTNTFQVSLTAGGAAVNLTSTGGVAFQAYWISSTGGEGLDFRDMGGALWITFDAGRGDGTAGYDVVDALDLPALDFVFRTAAIYNRGALSDLRIFQYSFANGKATGYTDSALWNSAWDSGEMSGLAIRQDAEDAFVNNCLIAGFMQACHSYLSPRGTYNGNLIDCMNGFEVSSCFDVAVFSDNHAFPLAAVGYSQSSLARRGTFIYLHDTVDWPKLLNNFTFGHKFGYRLANITNAQVSNCSADGAESTGAYGLMVMNLTTHTLINNFTAGAKEYGVHVNSGASIATTICGMTGSQCNTSLHVASGNVTVVGGTFGAPTSGTRIGVVNTGTGTVTLVNPTFVSCSPNIGPSSGGVSILPRAEKVYVEGFGAYEGATAAVNTTAIQAATAVLAALGGGTLVFGLGKTYDVFPSAGGATLMNLNGTDNVVVEGNGSTLQTAQVSATDPYYFFLNTDGADGITIRNLTVIGSNGTGVPDSTLGTEHFLWANGGWRNIRLENCNVYNCLTGLNAQPSGTLNSNLRMSNCYFDTCFYPVGLYEVDGANVQYKSVNGGRAFFCANPCRSIEAQIDSTPGWTSTDVQIGVYAKSAGDGGTEFTNTVSGLRVKYSSPGKYAGSGGFNPGLINLSFIQYNGNTAAGHMRDLEFILNVDGGAGADKFDDLFNINKYTSAAAADDVGRGHTIDTLRIAGSVINWDNATGKGVVICDTAPGDVWDDSVSGTPDQVTNVDLSDLTIQGVPTGTDPVWINCQPAVLNTPFVNLGSIKIDSLAVLANWKDDTWVTGYRFPWVPVLQFLNDEGDDPTYGVQNGAWMLSRNGKLHINGNIVLTDKGTSTGSARIIDMPFTVRNNDDSPVPVVLRTEDVTYTGSRQGYAVKNTKTIILEDTTEAGVTADLDDTNFADTSEVLFGAEVFVEAA